MGWLEKTKYFCKKGRRPKTILELNTEGVQQRKRRKLIRWKYPNPGTNYIWHIDGHNKLKPFGFLVNGSIDRFSRKLIWLEVISSNKVPEIISQYYLKATKRLKGVEMRADETE